MWGIIGGSGFEKFEELDVVESLDLATPFGQASSGFKKVSLNGSEFLFLSRHGQSHELMPSEVNYRANIFALKRAGVTGILSISAVGSLKKELAPGDMVVPSQYIDRTKSVRDVTFCGDGVVGHVSLAKPVSELLIEKLKGLSSELDFKVHWSKTYLCVEGPYFSTKAESNVFRSMGADIIGMTNFPEYALAREAGMSYLPCSFVTDYDCWDDSIPHVTLTEVLTVMRKNNRKAFQLVSAVLESGLKSDPLDRESGLRTGLMSSPDNLPAEKRDWLEVLRA